jgi:GAF domain-containing protein
MTEETANVSAKATGLTMEGKLRLLLEITRKISRSLNLEEVLAQVMNTLDSLLPYDAAGIYIIRRDPHLSEGGTSSLVFHAEAVRGYDIEELMELRLKLGEGLIGWVAQKAEAVVVPDVREDARYVNARKETRSEVVAPIISNDEVIGVFDLESDDLNAYTEDDRQLLTLLASQVAIIVEKAIDRGGVGRLLRLRQALRRPSRARHRGRFGEGRARLAADGLPARLSARGHTHRLCAERCDGEGQLPSVGVNRAAPVRHRLLRNA